MSKIRIFGGKNNRRDSMSKKREKRLRPLGRPFGRMAVKPLFATKPRYGGGVGEKVIEE